MHMVITQYPRWRGIGLTFNVVYLVLSLVLLASCDSGSGNTTFPSQCATRPPSPITLTMYYSSEKQAWIEDVVNDFKSRRTTPCDGSITIKAIPIGSGQSMQQIVDGSIQPDIWSPASSVWLTLINSLWRKKYDSALVDTGATSTPSLVLTPVVIAMWKNEAEALGWPTKPIGWADIASLSTNPRGWAAYGHPELGNFKFGHTRPDDSNSGLDAVIAENYAAVGKESRLTLDDVNSPKTRDFVANVESSVIQYGESTGFFADEMFNRGPGYLSAAVMYENLVIQANDGKMYPHLPQPIVAIYPKEGTFYSDHPFVIPQTSWVTPAKKDAALRFRDFLLNPAEQKKALAYGFRPANPNNVPVAPIDQAHGADPNQPAAILQVPSAEVVKAIQDSWNQQRRKVDVMLVLDRSGSMNDLVGGVSKISAAKQGLIEFINLLGASDGLGLTVFSTDADVLRPLTPLGSQRQDILNKINGITANGSTRLFDTIAEQWQALKALPSKHNKALIVLTDGIDTSSQRSLDQLLSEITPSGGNAGEGIKIFTIAYGNNPNAEVCGQQKIANTTGGVDVCALMKIANATGEQKYDGTPQNIKQVYLQISQFFV